MRSLSVEATVSKLETFQPHEAQRLKPMGQILIWSSVVVPVSHRISLVTSSEEIPLTIVRYGDMHEDFHEGKKVWVCYLKDGRAERTVVQVGLKREDLVLCEDVRAGKKG